MDKIEYGRLYEIAEKQEKMLRFKTFSNKEAWELGAFMVEKAKEKIPALSSPLILVNSLLVQKQEVT